MALADFEGAEDIRNAWLAGLAPDPALTVSQWADRHRILSSRAASEAGPYRTARTPFMRAIMDALSPASPARRVVFKTVGMPWEDLAVARVVGGQAPAALR